METAEPVHDPRDWRYWPRCSYCLGPSQKLTRSPLKLCRECYEYLGRGGRKQVKAVRDVELALVKKARKS